MERSGASQSVRYVTERVLGRGGMSTVYLARDTATGRHVALKVIADHLGGDPQHRARFLREARLAAGLSHPNVVSVHDVEEDEGTLSIVMEHVDGETLAHTLARGRLSQERTLDIGVDVCAALEHAHAAGLVHRDVTPHNILLARDGTAKLTDFGIARPAHGATLTEHGTILGTLAYLAPEQARGEPVGAAADIYSLGAVLYECLAGRPPYQADSLPALLLQRERSAAPPVRSVAPEVSPALAAAVDRCLDRSPKRRPGSAAVLADALRDAAAQEESRTLVVAAAAPTRALRSAAPTVVLRSPRARRRAAAMAALAMLVAGGVAAAVVPNGDGPQARTASASKRSQPPPSRTELQQPALPPPAAALVATPPPPPPCDDASREPSGRGEGHGKGHGKAKGHGKKRRNAADESDPGANPC